jgi:hypothetical protein
MGDDGLWVNMEAYSECNADAGRCINHFDQNGGQMGGETFARHNHHRPR